ncbi:CPBP family intramembrane glutamic endopeptidase [Enterococcus rivorum]|uniref:CAAX protease n=2 Tax=Enterococcus rivorum TaxID=762845 RepID=A0A1E5KTU2_9ENTE|nr:membrane protease YdiL (CAAX protease family) [Enterococcus rivorum]OEH81276.1 CAAX protease [Enterococcus rivorum]
MSIKKVSILSIIIYFFTFFSPFFLVLISKNMLVPGVTFLYIISSCLMIFLYFTGKEPALIEQNSKLSSPVFMFLLGVSGIFLAMLLQGIVFSIESIFTGMPPSSQNTKKIIDVILKKPIFILATTIAGPIMEEFVFRRSLLSLMQPYSGFWISAGISSAMFSIAHQDGHFFVYFCMGLFFCFLYKITGKIWTPIIAHCGMNALVVLAQLAVYYGS